MKGKEEYAEKVFEIVKELRAWNNLEAMKLIRAN